jgi:hypothetical protein
LSVLRTNCSAVRDDFSTEDTLCEIGPRGLGSGTRPAARAARPTLVPRPPTYVVRARDRMPCPGRGLCAPPTSARPFESTATSWRQRSPFRPEPPVATPGVGSARRLTGPMSGRRIPASSASLAAATRGASHSLARLARSRAFPDPRSSLRFENRFRTDEKAWQN